MRLAERARLAVDEPAPVAPPLMKLWLMSDLGVEQAPFAMPDPLPDFDALVVAGDVAADPEASVRWLAAALGPARAGRPIVLVPGDGEFRAAGPMRAALLRAKAVARDLGIVVLADAAVRLDDGHGHGVHVIGATLWTDWSLDGPGTAGIARGYARHYWPGREEVRMDGGRRMTPHDAAGLHARSRAFIEDALAGIVVGEGGFARAPNPLVPIVAAGDRAVVVTHFAPSRSSLPPDLARRQADPWRATFYASDLESVMRAWGAPALWLHGHVPRPVDYRIGDTRVVANPRTHAGAVEPFRPDLVLEV